MINARLGLDTYPAHLCGPCHRAQGGTGLSTMAKPSRPDLDRVGGTHGLCDGHDGTEHAVHLDHLGEPMSVEKYGVYLATVVAFDGDVEAGHTLIAQRRNNASVIARVA